MLKKCFLLFFLVCFCLISIFPSSSSAHAESLSESKEITQTEDHNNEPSKKIKELVEERGQNYKKYQLSNGKFLMEAYLFPIHFQDESGRYQDINTDLIDELDIPNTASSAISKDATKNKIKIESLKNNREESAYTTFQTPFYSELPKKISKGYSVEKNGEKVVFIPVGASNSSKAQLNNNQKDKVVYKNVWSNTDIELQVLNYGVKENIILNNSNSPRSFAFEVKGDFIDDLTSSQFYFENPWIIDSNNVVREVTMTRREEGNKIYIDYSWDNDGLVYPLIIDPTVSVQLGNAACYNQYYLTYGCNSSNITTAFKNSSEGNSNNITGETFRSYLQFNIPQIKNVQVTSAAVSMSLNPNSFDDNHLDPIVDVTPYAIVGNWPTTTYGVAWGAKPELYTASLLASTNHIELFATGAAKLEKFDVTGIYNFYQAKSSPTMIVAIVSSQLNLLDKEFILSFSNPVLEVTYVDKEAPTQPKDLYISSMSSTSTSLKWTSSTDNASNVVYMVYQNGSYINMVTTNTLTVNGLTANQIYRFTIRAMDSAGNYSKYSNPITVITGSNKPIANFLNLTEDETYTSPLIIQWSYYDPSSKPIKNFEIKGSTDNWSTVSFTTGSLPAGTINEFSKDLVPSKTWSFAIRVDNGSGMGEWSYINNIRIKNSSVYYYDTNGRLDYIIINNIIKIDYQYDNNGNLIKIDKIML